MRKNLKNLVLTGALAFSTGLLMAAPPDSENYRKGLECYDNWQYNEAMNYFDKADEEFPDNGYIYFNVGKILFMADDPENCYKVIAYSIDLFKPEDVDGIADALMYLGNLATTADMYGLEMEDPIKYYNAAINIYPENYKVWLERGIYRDIYLKDFDNSNADYRKAIALNKTEVEPYTRLAQSYETEQGKPEEAIAVYKECVENVKDYPYHHDALARLLISKGEYDEAANLMLQGMDMINEEMANDYSLYYFPEKQKEYLKQEITKRAKAHPEQDYWQSYLEMLNAK